MLLRTLVLLACLAPCAAAQTGPPAGAITVETLVRLDTTDSVRGFLPHPDGAGLVVVVSRQVAPDGPRALRAATLRDGTLGAFAPLGIDDHLGFVAGTGHDGAPVFATIAQRPSAPDSLRLKTAIYALRADRGRLTAERRVSVPPVYVAYRETRVLWPNSLRATGDDQYLLTGFDYGRSPSYSPRVVGVDAAGTMLLNATAEAAGGSFTDAVVTPSGVVVVGNWSERAPGGFTVNALLGLVQGSRVARVIGAHPLGGLDEIRQAGTVGGSSLLLASTYLSGYGDDSVAEFDLGVSTVGENNALETLVQIERPGNGRLASMPTVGSARYFVGTHYWKHDRYTAGGWERDSRPNALYVAALDRAVVTWDAFGPEMPEGWHRSPHHIEAAGGGGVAIVTERRDTHELVRYTARGPEPSAD